MDKLFGAQWIVLQAVRDLPPDDAGFVSDAQASVWLDIAVEDVRDWMETLEGDGCLDVARTQRGVRASITAKGRLALRRCAAPRAGEGDQGVPIRLVGEEPTPFPPPRGRVVYDSSSEVPPFGSWTVVCSSRRFSERLMVLPIPERDGGGYAYRMESTADERVGINKPVNCLRGVVEFEYSVVGSDSTMPNVCFYMIPMQETGPGRTGLIEVGAGRQNDPRSHTSPYRVRKYASPSRYGDGAWHRESLEFDFREVQGAFYSIFGPRINEGTGYVSAAVSLIRNVVITSR